MALRGPQIISGTSSTGAIGTATAFNLSAIPTGVGGIDFDTWFRATGNGLGNNAAFLVDLNVTEYHDNTYVQPKQQQAGVAKLTLGASAGIANCTMQFVSIDWTCTGMDTASQSPSINPGATGITIGTAANVLVSIEPRSENIPAFSSYVDTGFGDGLGLLFPLHNAPSTALGGNFALGATQDNYQLFTLFQPLSVKKASVRNAVTAGSNTGTAWARIFEVGSNGRPGSCLVDFGQLGGVNALQTIANLSSAPLTNAKPLDPGDYFFDTIVSSITGSPAWAGPNTNATGKGAIPISARMGSNNTAPYLCATATGGTAGALTPGTAANLTSYAPLNTLAYFFWLSP